MVAASGDGGDGRSRSDTDDGGGDGGDSDDGGGDGDDDKKLDALLLNGLLENDLRKQAAAAPRDPEPRWSLGLVLAQRGDEDGAE